MVERVETLLAHLTMLLCQHQRELRCMQARLDPPIYQKLAPMVQHQEPQRGKQFSDPVVS